MKKVVLSLVMVLFLLTGCAKNDAQKACKEAATKVYVKANDTTITKCVSDYEIEAKKVVYTVCINTEETLYTSMYGADQAVSFVKDGAGYDNFLSVYNQTAEKALKNNDEKYYAFEFKADELK